MSEFKPGDKVRCIANTEVPAMTVGEAYTVKYSRMFSVDFVWAGELEYVWLEETGGWIIARPYLVKQP